MYNLTILFTHHSEVGKCCVEELHTIIESINPDVIFEELTKDLFDRIYREDHCTAESLEIKSIKKYLLRHNVNHHPVDISVNPNISVSDIEYMFGVFKKFDVYKKIEDQQKEMIAQEGFAFLNSQKNMELFEQKFITEKNLIGFTMNKDWLHRIHKLFYEEHDQRETAIIENIHKYSSQNQFNQALLLIGSGHAKSILEKIEKSKAQQNLKLNWTLYPISDL